MRKPERYWQALMRDGECLESACAALELVLQKEIVPAVHPTAPKGYIGVEALPVKTTTHILFKDPRTTKDDFYPRERVPAQYRRSHAERINWILPTLLDPDEVAILKVQLPKQPNAYLYVLEPFIHERFVVVVKTQGHKSWMATAFDVDLSLHKDHCWWAEFRQNYRQVKKAA